MKKMALALAVVSMTALSGCGWSGSSEEKMSQVVCPEVGMMQQASEITVFNGTPGAEPKDDVVSVGTLDWQGACNLDKQGVAKIKMKVNFAAKKGPKGDMLKAQELPYFVAVLDSDENVVQREEYSTKVGFDESNMGMTEEEHAIKFPVASKDAAQNYKVVVGFRLTPEQAAFNKAN